MLDPSGAKKAITASSTLLLSIGVNPIKAAAKSSSWKTLIDITFALLYSNILKEFPSRLEVSNSIKLIQKSESVSLKELVSSINITNSSMITTKGDGIKATKVNSPNVLSVDLPYLPKIVTLPVQDRTIPVPSTNPLLDSVPLGIPQMESIIVFAGDPVSAALIG